MVPKFGLKIMPNFGTITLGKRTMSVNCRATIFLGLLAVMLTACEAPRTAAPVIDPAAARREAELQKEFALRSNRREWQRLVNVGAPLLEASAGLCGDKLTPYLGVNFRTIHEYAVENRAAAAKVYRLDDTPRVSQVVARSPAARAGFQTGDALLEIAGRPVFPGAGAAKQLSKLLDQLIVAGQPVTFKVARGPANLALRAVPTQRCSFDLRLVNDGTINAYADGKNVVIHRGLMRFIESDQHLAVVVGHEIAHNAMGHIDAKKKNAVVGMLGGLLADIAAAALGVDTGGTFTDLGARAGAGAYSIAFEQEADYVGLYVLARAGYPVDGTADLWRLMATANLKSISFAGLHPTSPERYLGMEQHIREINGKVAANMRLVPEGVEETAPAPRYALATLPQFDNTYRTGLIAPSPPAPAVIQQFVALPAGSRWVGSGGRDACGEPWSADLTVADNKLTGMIERGGVTYDVRGNVDAAGGLDGGRAGKNQASKNLIGPRFLKVVLDFGPDKAVGSYAIDAYGRQSCVTPLALGRVTR